MAQDFFTVDLPDFNGTQEIGLGVTGDMALPEVKMLRVYTHVAGHDAADEEGIIAYRKRVAFASATDMYLRMRASVPEDNQLRFLVNAAYALVITGAVVQKRANEQAEWVTDGDWVLNGTAAMPSLITDENMQETKAAVAAMLAERATMSEALVIVTACNVVMWATNHHTGSFDNPHAYLKKVLATTTIWRLMPGTMAAKIELVHQASHWTSFREFIRRLGARGVANNGRCLPHFEWNLRFGTDMQLRAQSLPANVHKIVVAYESSMRMLATPVAHAIRDFAPFTRVVTTYRGICDDPDHARYHPGAAYLRNNHDQPVRFSNDIVESVLGRAGYFMRTIAPRHTLCNSPALTAEAVSSYNDFDPNFNKIVNAYRRAISDPAVGDAVEEMIAAPNIGNMQEFIAAQRAAADAVMALAIPPVVPAQAAGPQPEN